MKKGISLIEVVVAMGIFATIATLTIGAFVSVSKMKSLTSLMNETQQKTRIAMEMISRLSRQAEKVITYPDGSRIDLYFDIESESVSAASFRIEGTDLRFYNCTTVTELECTSWEAGQSLYSGINIVLNDPTRQSGFVKEASDPPVLRVDLYGEVAGASSSLYYSDSLNLNTSVILESLK
jgi:type II secretory pathway pseudopilin PulG